MASVAGLTVFQMPAQQQAVNVGCNYKMTLRYLILFLLVQTTTSSFSQCIDREKIKYGGDYGFVDYIHRCPTYNFAFGGDTSRFWNVLDDPIDITQSPKEVIPLKQKIEEKIKTYCGDTFFKNLKFSSVEVVYKDKLKEFRDSGRQDVTLKYCKAKYFFYYEFKPDTLATYLIGIAVDRKGMIMNRFNFPSKDEFKFIDNNISICKLVEIARKTQPQIDPIKEITFEYDEIEKRFYWLVSQEIQNIKEGKNNFKQVVIDASDLTRTKAIIGSALIQF